MSKRPYHSTLTPEQRSMQARMAAHLLHATRDTHETTEAARYAAHVTRYEKMVDPNNELPPAERARRVEAARQAHMTKAALASSRARAQAGRVMSTRLVLVLKGCCEGCALGRKLRQAAADLEQTGRTPDPEVLANYSGIPRHYLEECIEFPPPGEEAVPL